MAYSGVAVFEGSVIEFRGPSLLGTSSRTELTVLSETWMSLFIFPTKKIIFPQDHYSNVTSTRLKLDEQDDLVQSVAHKSGAWNGYSLRHPDHKLNFTHFLGKEVAIVRSRQKRYTKNTWTVKIIWANSLSLIHTAKKMATGKIYDKSSKDLTWGTNQSAPIFLDFISNHVIFLMIRNQTKFISMIIWAG